ncbi:hypothetical protein [Phytomonospora endophytica]|uniref:Uncharacterized protein n=1 Tax=Phytomonospora endophytica TaxID=714109 RepID=A0A841FEF1_9ACTN|nr:hypothetical protein [Phytomonospora endophytica]MBB6032218.1 hypothetical protein [Phytomonospora endophytica]GIG68567.1 hypothetical protein Pen01_48620 [Phytomonospora endophytica]
MVIRILRDEHGAHVITPHDGPPPEMPDVDAAVLDVAGGHLTWSVLSDAGPVAVIDDLDAAQSWIWAVYGEAAAVADTGSTVDADPALPELVVAAARLAYAHWAARWWPASTIDAIPALDETLLAEDLAELTTECELLFAADEAEEAPATVPARGPSTAYALAAGPSTGPDNGIVLSRGTTGTDWRRIPPGLVDASEQAVSWQVTRIAAQTVVAVSAVPAPGLPTAVPAHLWPHATVTGEDIALRLAEDAWIGDSALPPSTGPEVTVDVHLPGLAAPSGPGDRALRTRVRAFVHARLDAIRAGTLPDPLRAETAAAATETDY